MDQLKKFVLRLAGSLFFWIFLFSLLLSLTLLVGRVDQDFFSWYYIGRGVAKGMSLYRDFAENKGPVLYFFFAFLYRVFGTNYKLALIFSNCFLDATAIFFLIKLLETWVNFHLSTRKWGSLFLLFFIVAYYKSFSIGTFVGGIYSETLAVCLLLASLFFLEKQKELFSGILFSLAIFSRPTIAFYLIFFLVRILFLSTRPKLKLSGFIIGLVMATIGLLGVVLARDSLKDFINNLLLFNLNYATAVKRHFYSAIIEQFYLETRILLVLILAVSFWLWSVIKDRKESETILFVTALFLSGILSSFVGGLFYFHHFIQFSPFFLVALSFFISNLKKIKTWILLGPLLLFVLFDYWSFLGFGPYSRHANVDLSQFSEKINARKYLMAIPFYPELYIVYNKKAPDRYYQSFFLLDSFNQRAYLERKRHLGLDRERLRNTLFLIVGNSEESQSYLENFEAPFDLRKIDTWQMGRTGIDVYVSKI